MVQLRAFFSADLSPLKISYKSEKTISPTRQSQKKFEQCIVKNYYFIISVKNLIRAIFYRRLF